MRSFSGADFINSLVKVISFKNREISMLTCLKTKHKRTLLFQLFIINKCYNQKQMQISWIYIKYIYAYFIIAL